MGSDGTYEEQQIIRRLKTIKGHMNAVVEMMENERSYDEIILQLEAIRSAITNTTSVLAQCYVQASILESLQNGDFNVDSIKKPIEILMRVSEHSTQQSRQFLFEAANIS